MKITKTSPLSGKVNTLDLNITPEQYAKWQAGTLVQHAFPHLTTDEREFLITGTTKEEWDALFGAA